MGYIFLPLGRERVKLHERYPVTMGGEMNWSTEKDIRLFIASRFQSKPSNFISIYKELEEKADDSEMLVKIDGRKVA